MLHLNEVPTPGAVVMAIIGLLFVLALIQLFAVYGRYGSLARRLRRSERYQDSSFLCQAVERYANAYREYGEDTNTPAIVENVIASELKGSLLAERFLNNAVSLFVTLGLFGTFLGLSLSVASLTELISFSNTSDWLNVLDSVGGGLMSALSGMGVAFYTSLVGAGCSIILTLLRAIFNPQAQRAVLENELELWLDEQVAPGLVTDRARTEGEMLQGLIAAMNRATAAMEKSMEQATESMTSAIAQGEQVVKQFDRTVGGFNQGIRDFAEFEYNLRGTVERMDVASRDLVTAMRRATRELEGSGSR